MADTIKPGGGWSQIYNSIFDQSIMGIVLCAMDGSILESNPAFCRMVGWSREELLGARPPFVYWPAEEIERIQEAFQHAE